MNIQHNESTAFSIYQRRLLPICFVDCPSNDPEGAKKVTRKKEKRSMKYRGAIYASGWQGKFLL